VLPTATDSLLNDGTYSNPLKYLEDAMEKAHEHCAPYTSSCEVNIKLMKGTHFILRGGNRDPYFPTSQSRDSQNMKLTISPLFSSDCSSQPAGCTDQAIADIETITIKNKKRDKFQIKVGGGLTLKNIIIDSLDSLVCKSARLIYSNR
jgi:hypothetical protein